MKDLLKGCAALGGVWLIFKAGEIKGMAVCGKVFAEQLAKEVAKQEEKK